jgi:hypothetical protein
MREQVGMVGDAVAGHLLDPACGGEMLPCAL